MRNKWKLPPHERRETVAIIQGHSARRMALASLDPAEYDMAAVQELRKVNAVIQSVNEAAQCVRDSAEREKVKKWLILNLENNKKYPFISFNTDLTEWQFFNMQYHFIYLVNKKLKS